MSSKQPPTILFSIGSWLTPDPFTPLRTKLSEKNIPSEVPAHPSIGAEPPTRTLTDDIVSLRSILSRLVEDEGKDVIVVGHSSGGISASGAVEGLSKKERVKDGKEGGVLMVVYMAAFVLDKGMSLLNMLGGEYLPWMEVDGDYVRVTSNPEIAFHDVSPSDQAKYASLQHTSRILFSGTATYEPWHTIPSAYIITEEDRALPPQLQGMMAGKLGTDPELVVRIKSSHSPFLSMPDELASVLEGIAEDGAEKVGGGGKVPVAREVGTSKLRTWLSYVRGRLFGRSA
ncbi:alpha/beta hydrolase [Aspergillus stella-maris]|uniref:alpha/beta hydrolase n=1 Tax=Aspergillus stella-maris TaxID=1810926 RepID=UPI003CCE3BA3